MNADDREELQQWRSALSVRVDELERKLIENTAVSRQNSEAIQRVENNTKEVVEILQSWMGAMKVLGLLYKASKPVAAVVAFVVSSYIAWKTGVKL